MAPSTYNTAESKTISGYYNEGKIKNNTLTCMRI